MFISKKDLELLEEKLNNLIKDLRQEIEALKGDKPVEPRQKRKKVVD